MLLRGAVLGSLDERLDEQRVLGDPGGDGEDALGDAHLPQQRVVAALLHKLLEPAVGLELLLVDGHRVQVLRAERSIGGSPSDGEKSEERIKKKIFRGWF